METVNELLDLYFAGETTLAQEQKLKQYFASGNIAEEHKAYQQLFAAFVLEKQEKYPENMPKIAVQPYSKRPFFLSLISAVAMAACVLLLFGIFRTNPSEDFVVINGKRIDDRNLAIQTAKEKLTLVSERLSTGLKPVRNIYKIRESMRPLQKIQAIQTKMQNTFEKINITL